MNDVIIFLVPLYLLAVNLIAFVIYGIDKLKAKKGRRRVPEKTLLLLSVCGGFIGAFAAMQLFRHKTRHYYFYLTAFLSLVIWGMLLWFSGYISLLLSKI